MSKSDSPPMRMVVERGPRLAPATASDAERLDTWRIGSQVNVQFVRLGSRPMERKWWAILGLVVNQCNVPWKTKEQASEAVKLALGIVNLTKTVGGSWMQYPKSLTELDDAELDDAVRDMADLITKMTGIDPETLHKESADVGQDETEQPADPASPTVGPGSGDSQAAAPDQSASGGPDEDGAEAETTTSSDAPSSDNDEDRVRRMLMSECAENFIRDATSAPADKREEKITRLHKVWLQELTGQAKFVDLCRRTAEKLIANPSDKPKAEAYLAGMVK